MSSSIKGLKTMQKFGLGSSGKTSAEVNTMVLSRDSSTSHVLPTKAPWSSTKKSSSATGSKPHSSKDISSQKKCTTPETSMKNLNSSKRKSTKKTHKANLNPKIHQKIQLKPLHNPNLRDKLAKKPN